MLQTTVARLYGLNCQSPSIICNEDAFRAAVRQGESLVEKGKIVTFGNVATHAETGYG
jgi:mannose-1-phosphate guanylyltransferase